MAPRPHMTVALFTSSLTPMWDVLRTNLLIGSDDGAGPRCVITNRMTRLTSLSWVGLVVINKR